MAVCHKNKFIFFHIPRCGGTSINKVFGFKNAKHLCGVIKGKEEIVTLHHLTPTDMLNAKVIEDKTFHSYFKFTVIRDPFDRMASDYLWQQSHDTHGIFADMDFQSYLQFAEKVITEGLYFKKKHYDHFRPMVMYCVKDDKLLVDDILLLENIDNHLDRIKDKIGQVSLSKRNSSKNYEHLRTSSNLKMVYDLYAPDKALYESILALDKNEIID